MGLALPLSFYSLPSQFTPSPVNPSLHAQVNEPGVFVQSALLLQLLPPFSHSFMSKKYISNNEMRTALYIIKSYQLIGRGRRELRLAKDENPYL